MTATLHVEHDIAAFTKLQHQTLGTLTSARREPPSLPVLSLSAKQTFRLGRAGPSRGLFSLSCWMCK